MNFCPTLARWGALATTWIAPAIALASPEQAGHGEHDTGIVWYSPPIGNTGKTGLIWILLNFAVLMWILDKLLFRKLRARTAEKSDTIKSELERATEARQQAEQVMSDVRDRLAQLDTEVASILADAKARGEADRQRIIEAAKREAERIEVTARVAAEREAENRRRQIEAEIVDQAVGRAEALLRQRIDASAQQRMANDFIQRLGKVDLPGGSRAAAPGAQS